ncbi:4Fe-4S dicluster domain-containing protein [Lachnospiraceae bacterium G41]|nr:4Fe-4S dicluster domain-containing protein [Lachnospiraceae bacterium G41]
MLKTKMDLCTGCRACEQICPQTCITFNKDKEGFLYPRVEENNCINCNLCNTVCHAQVSNKSELIYHTKERKGYYGRVNESELLKNSSSGGAFSQIVEEWLDDEGIVFGATFSADFRYIHHTACSKQDYIKLRKSKYVFSDTEQTYSECKKKLQEGKKVIFSGTPCQIAGLLKFLGNKPDSLLTIDFICHGTPSIDIYNHHIDWIAKGRKVTGVDFRSKAMGWRKHCLKVNLSKETYLRSIEEDYYMCEFMRYSMLRLCCYTCEYSNGNHISDITLADFWGIKRVDESYIDDNGVSLLIFNTQTNEELLTKLMSTMELRYLEPKDYNYVFKTHSSYDANERKRFFLKYEKKGWDRIATQYYRSRFLRKIIRVLKK